MTQRTVLVVVNGQLKQLPAGDFLYYDGYSGHIEVPTAKTYTIDEYAVQAATIDSVALKLSAGTATVAIKINGTAVTSLSAIAVTTTQSVTSATGANTVAAGDKITLVVTVPASAADLSFTLKTH